MKEMTINEFLYHLGSKEPVPGGGGAAAISSAMGIALGQMVANLTVGKKKYEEYEDEVREYLHILERLKQESLEFVEKDAKAFLPVTKAYQLPKNTPEEIHYRNQFMEEALLSATMVPMEIMEFLLKVIIILERLSKIGTRLAISDIGVAVQCCRSSLLSSSMNVFINTKLMKNKEKAQELEEKARLLMQQGTKKCDEIFEYVFDQITN